jgi:hypothetical protein
MNPTRQAQAFHLSNIDHGEFSGVLPAFGIREENPRQTIFLIFHD